MTDDRCQKTDVRSQKTDVRRQMSEVTLHRKLWLLISVLLFLVLIIPSFFDSSGFASKFAQIVNFGASHTTPGNDFYFINNG